MLLIKPRGDLKDSLEIRTAATGVIRDGMDIVGIPVQVGDRAVILSGIEHHEVKQIAELEVSPDT
jgi:hypothetical protein